MTRATIQDVAINEALEGLRSLAAELSAETYRSYTVKWDPSQKQSFSLVELDDCDGWPMHRYSTLEKCQDDIQALLQNPSPLEKSRNPNVVEIERFKEAQGCY